MNIICDKNSSFVLDEKPQNIESSELCDCCGSVTPIDLFFEGFYDFIEDLDFIFSLGSDKESESDVFSPNDALDDDFVELMTYLDFIKEHPNDLIVPM